MMRLAPPRSSSLGLLAAAGCGGSGGGATRVSTGLPPAGGGGTLAYALPELPATIDPARGAHARPAHRRAAGLRAADRAPLGSVRRGGAAGGPRARGAAIAGPNNLDGHPAPNVRFQDGTPFNAAAVLANSRRWQSDPAGQKLLPHLFAVDAPRPDEVRFLLEQPVPDLVRRLSSPRLGIVSPAPSIPRAGRAHASSRMRRARARAPSSLGRAGRAGRCSPGSPAGGGARWASGPSFDGVTFVLAPQQGQRLRLLREGAVQVADPLGPGALRAAASDPLLDTVRGSLGGIGLEGSVRGIDSAQAIPVLSSVWLTRLVG